MSDSPTIAGWAVRVTGVVQGVGFRPFVYRLATELGCDGVVGNDESEVFIEVAAPSAVLATFVERLRADAPPAAVIEQIEVREAPPTAMRGFAIVASRSARGPVTPVSPDLACCPACVAELFDPMNRRYRHPFITCTDCGPRFTITTGLPYDRPNTTMAGFALCPACRAEYEDPLDRRYHAQPIACHACGPTLTCVLEGSAPSTGEAAIAEARDALRAGAILAVKGIGGYHLICSATNDDAVAELRRRKRRGAKPFAVMVPDLDAASRLAELGAGDALLLESPMRPIVLARARPDSPCSAHVAPHSPLVGVLLAYTPLHHLLFGETGASDRLGPLVATSSNRAGEPICYRDDDLAERLGVVVDGVVGHDRSITTPCDDSVVRSLDGVLLPMRRSRGFAPLPVAMAGLGTDALAVGAELKNTFCVATGGRAYLSQHIGDMENLATLDAFEDAVGRLCALFRVEPEIVAIDAHPGYLSARWATARFPDRVVKVQHHHAHIASLIAEHGRDPDAGVIGMAFDGTGYGSDGTIWGGEILEANASTAVRAAHLTTVLLPGGDVAVRHPWRVALSYLRAADVGWEEDLEPVRHGDALELDVIERCLATGVASVASSSMGRLFDAVASILGICHEVSYEAEAAIALEYAAMGFEGRHDDAPTLAFGAVDGGYDAAPVIAGIVEARRAGGTTSSLAHAFHVAVARLVLDAAEASRGRTGWSTVACSGGVWQNGLLVQLAGDGLAAQGFEVLTHRLVPPNDGGLALGQMLVASRQTSREREG